MEVFLNAHTERTFKKQDSDIQARTSLRESGSLVRLCSGAIGVWLDICLWFRVNSFAPLWLSKPLRRPAIGYLVAGLVALGGVIGSLLLSAHFPIFAVAGTLTTMGIVVVGINWGAGPSLLATLVATALTALCMGPLYLEQFAHDVPVSACVLLFLLTGFGI